MLRVGLTGGMGAGKSTVAGILGDCGAVIIDSDVIAREVVAAGTPGLASLVDAFGTEILAEDGTLHRAALAARAFADDTSRAMLNAITHPLVGARAAELIAEASPDAIVVQDIPLLVENRLGSLFHLVIVVMADVETRVHRLVEQRGIAENDVRARIAAQATDEQRRAVADVTVDNGGAEKIIVEQVRVLFRERLVEFEHNIRTRHCVPSQYRLVPANPEWPAQAARLIGRLRVVCGSDARSIDHIGSTAVAGLDAKDVIDIQITVSNMDVADGLRDRLADAGFPCIAHIRTDNPHSTGQDHHGRDVTLWSKRIHCSADPGRPANVHLRVDGSPGQRFALIFRDWLRAEPTAWAEYRAVKRQAHVRASGLSGDEAAAAYLAVKEPWFDTAYPSALEWAATSRPA